MKKVLSLIMALLLTVAVTGCGSGGEVPAEDQQSESSETYTIQLAHGMMEDTPQHKGAEEFKRLVEEKTDGRVEVSLFPAGQLGSDVEIAEMLQTGGIEAGIVPTAKLSGFYAPLQIIDLPFLFPTKEVTYEVLDSAEFKSMLFGPMEELGFKGINFWESGFKQFTANKELKTPDDFKGVKFRVMESPLLIAQFEALGANPLSIDFSETYNSLQQGACDGQENPLNSIVNMKFYEVQTNMTISNHGYLAYALMFSKQYWDTLPEDIQTAIIEAADEAVVMERQFNAEEEVGYVQTIEDYGTEVYTLNDEEIAAFSEVMRPVHEEFRDVIGSDVLDTTYQLVEEATA